MSTRLTRWPALSGLAAVVLWILGLVISQGLSHSLSSKATDPQILSWIKSNTNYVLTGGWLFMIGCLCFIWFGAFLRSRLIVLR